MSLTSRLRQVLAELRHHAPFTILGAVTGLALMGLFLKLQNPGGHLLFAIFHPGHVILSAMVTAALYRRHRPQASFLVVLLVGYVGSIGIATLSDSVIPYLGEQVLGLDIPAHHELHEQPHPEETPNHAEHEHQHEEVSHLESAEHHHTSGVHLGFIEEWYIVNPAALVGILLGFFTPLTRLPHATHVLVSTWASSAHMIMNTQSELTAAIAAGIIAVLFLAVWLPCCISDIVFPMLLVKGPGQPCRQSTCTCDPEHAHEHTTLGHS